MNHPTGLGEYTTNELKAELSYRLHSDINFEEDCHCASCARARVGWQAATFTPQQVQQMMNEALDQQTYKLSPNSDEKMVIVEQVRQSIPSIIKKYGGNQ